MAKSHLATLICTAAAFIGCGFAIFTGFGNIPVVNINVISVLILVVYIISLRYLSAEESGETEASESPLTVKQIIWRFSLTAIGLVGASILITVLTDRIAAMLSLEASLAGALFLGIATSLPELTSSIALVRKGNYNAMIGNVVGSNMFNFTILSVCDLLSRGENLYVGSAQTVSMLVFGVISTLLVGVVLFCKQRQGKSLPKRARFAMYALPALLTLVSYLSFLMVSM